MLTFKLENDAHPNFADLSADTQARIILWIDRSIRPKDAPCWDFSHVFLNDRLEDETGISIPYDAFKEAMFHCGYYPADPQSTHWHYRISTQSPVFKRAYTHKAYSEYRQRVF